MSTERKSQMRLSHRALVTSLSTLLLVMSVGFANATSLYLKGNVIYRERIALPETAQIEVSLLDITMTDAPATMIAKTKAKALNSSPIPFELKFDSQTLNLDNHHYALQAKITDGKKILFASTANNPVFTTAENDTQIFVEMVSNSSTSENKQQLIGSWVINALNGAKPKGQTRLSVQFSADGRASIYSGCNNLGSDVKIDKKKITFGLLMSTQMACDTVLMEQEQKLIKAMTRITNFTMNADGLTLLDAQSKPVLKLKRG